MSTYPITCYGKTFNNSSELEEFCDELFERKITTEDHLILGHCYDRCCLSHFYWKTLERKYRRDINLSRLR